MAYQFFSTGMFILDEIHNQSSSSYDIIGGAGTYAALGAAFFAHNRHEVGLIVDKGTDFPQSTLKQIRSWHLGIIERDCPGRLTTRGWNNFVAHEERQFRYLAPKLQIQPADLLVLENGAPARAKSIHLICAPVRCERFVEDLGVTQDQLLLWEPVPTAALPAEFEYTISVAMRVNVFSPNALEAASLVSEQEPTTQDAVESLVERNYSRLIASGVFVVLRCGSMGAFATKGAWKKWYPAYHSDQSKVVDPSGAGNAFLGGLGISLAMSCKPFEKVELLHRAVCWATVAAGIVVESIGPPQTDKWTDQEVKLRLDSYITKYGF